MKEKLFFFKIIFLKFNSESGPKFNVFGSTTLLFTDRNETFVARDQQSELYSPKPTKRSSAILPVWSGIGMFYLKTPLQKKIFSEHANTHFERWANLAVYFW